MLVVGSQLVTHSHASTETRYYWSNISASTSGNYGRRPFRMDRMASFTRTFENLSSRPIWEAGNSRDLPWKNIGFRWCLEILGRASKGAKYWSQGAVYYVRNVDYRTPVVSYNFTIWSNFMLVLFRSRSSLHSHIESGTIQIGNIYNTGEPQILTMILQHEQPKLSLVHGQINVF
jgi:hypothetical protein